MLLPEEEAMKIVLALFLVGSLSMTSLAEEKTAPVGKETRVFELRTYTAVPGKMANLHARFRNHTCALLEKHGMVLIGFWTPTNEKGAEETLVYIVAHASEAAAKKSWDDFRKDPAWVEARNLSEKDGPIVKKVDSLFLKPTDYSKLK